MVISSLSVDDGFSRKSSAPSFVARTAISMLAWPDTSTIGVFTPAALQFFQHFDAALARHHHVGKNQVERFRAQQFHARDSRCRTR